MTATIHPWTPPCKRLTWLGTQGQQQEQGQGQGQGQTEHTHTHTHTHTVAIPRRPHLAGDEPCAVLAKALLENATLYNAAWVLNASRGRFLTPSTQQRELTAAARTFDASAYKDILAQAYADAVDALAARPLQFESRSGPEAEAVTMARRTPGGAHALMFDDRFACAFRSDLIAAIAMLARDHDACVREAVLRNHSASAVYRTLLTCQNLYGCATEIAATVINGLRFDLGAATTGAR